jgi:L-cysteine:1D-myo-inositol 2-amino-2-deoxy-alpha-D-glucopyranoside ligase
MKLFNSLTGRVESPIFSDPVRLYACGITPYDTTHVGHAFTYVAVDNVVRHLESRGLTVRYVQNVTDIDDDILRQAKKVGQDWRLLGDRWTRHYIEDMIALNVRPPDAFPRATDVIDGIVGMVERLLAAGVAYQAGGSVYFHIDAWAEFGKLSNLPRAEMLPISNERGNHPEDPNKRDPLDFVLWQAKAEGEPAWPSPWGPGRPGWHIECSTLATHWLGEQIDIHGGGDDLRFPHHECEIAQVEPLTGRPPFVRCWFHTAMVHHEGDKMSKSLGNLVMVRDLLDEFSADAVRLYLASHHYRESWTYDHDELAAAARQVDGLVRALKRASGSGSDSFAVQRARQAFEAALDDDLDTPQAVRRMSELAAEIQSSAGEVTGVQRELRRQASVLGLRLDKAEPEARVSSGWQTHKTGFDR